MGPVSFESDANEVLLNPRMPPAQAERLRSWLSVADSLKAHVFVLTSGTTAVSEGDAKWVALSRPAILASAQAVNAHLGSTSTDVWLHCLPAFHVGGIGIYARAHLSRARVVKFEGGWATTPFTESLLQTQATLCSLVPTQVYDLVEAGVRSPPSSRAILVGGGALEPEIYFAARALGWPVLPSYGLTETASAIAAARLDSLSSNAYPPLSLLAHAEAATDQNSGRLRIRASSLVTAYIALDAQGEPQLWDPKQDGWFLSDDLGECTNGVVVLQGRVGDRVKIGGETANLAQLRRMLARATASQSYALTFFLDARLGQAIELVAERGSEESDQVVAAYNAMVLPFERIRRVRWVERIPRTELGKVKWGELSTGESSS